MRDILTESLNAPSGRLAEIVLRRLLKGGKETELPDDICARLDRLVDAPGRPGKLARARLAAEVSYLFERAPSWTKGKLLPLFEWSSPDASDAWASRAYANFIGSPELFDLTKKPFLEIFSRNDLAPDDLRTFAEWLAAIIITNQASTENRYPITPAEARAALRRAGVNVLPTVGHRLAKEMEAAQPEQKVERWRTIVGPVFQSIWPLDVELQNQTSTFKLTQILMATGDAFSDAVDVIIPFIQPEDSRSYSTIYSISRAPEELYASSPKRMLDLIAAVVGEAPQGRVFALDEALSRVRTQEPQLAATRKFQKLLSHAPN